MPRPLKCRRICRLPAATEFTPDGVCHGEITLSVDEFEVIRLLDYDGLTQAQAARQMGIARATVTCIYAEARRKIAVAFVNARRLRIGGGNYALCENAANCCGKCSLNGCAACKNTACREKISAMLRRKAAR